MDNQYVIEFCYENLEDVKVLNNGNHIHARCPFCGDSKKSKSKKRFHLTLKETWVGHCFNCNWSGNFISLYAYFKGLNYSDAYKEINSFDKQIENFKNMDKCIHMETKKEIVEHNFNDIINDCVVENSTSIIDIKLLKVLNNFREKRQIPSNYPLFIANKGIYKNRIIIPIYKNNNIIYFQARATTELQEIKYLNPDTDKSFIILNEETLNPTKNIIITEGIIDAISVENGTCALGASITDEFLEKLFSKTEKNLIIALDNDERGITETLNIIENSFYRDKLLFFVSPKTEKDLNEILINKSVITNIYEFVIANSYTRFDIELKMKLEDLWHEISERRETLHRSKRRESGKFTTTKRKDPFDKNLF